MESYPFESLDQHHDYVVFSDNPAVTERVVRAMAGAMVEVMAGAIAHAGTEAVAAGPGCVHWRVPKGSTLASKAGKVLDAGENRRHLTTRSIRTLRKILAAG